MAKKKDEPIRPDIKPDQLQERAIEDYSDLAEAIQEVTFEGAERAKTFPWHDREIVYQAGADYAVQENIPHNQGITLACWVY
jgi:hypothetical protein